MPEPVRRAALLWLFLMWLPACATKLPQRAVGPSPDADRAAADSDWTRAETMQVALDEYSFRPGRLAFQEGRPYLLRLVNRGARVHGFTAPAFFQAAELRHPDPVTAEVRAKGGSVDVPAGGSRDVALVPLRSGTFPLECRKPLHELFGMEGEITVAP